MILKNFQLMARYNQWMNQQVYAAAAQLDNERLKQDMGAFFGSVFGTLNHNLVGDQLWLTRFLGHVAGFSTLNTIHELPPITALDQILYADFGQLQSAREALDTVIISLCTELHTEDLEHHLVYQTTDGETISRHFGLLLQHFFNHQTHHRGQLSTLLSQNGLDIGVTDLLVLIPEQMAGIG